MAFSVGGGSSNGRSRFRGRHTAMAEINVVPLVDVVLVLLIIFMLTAHVMEFGLEVDVPKVKQTRDTNDELPVVTLTRNGDVYLGEKPVNINVLGETIRKNYPKSKAAFVSADKDTVYDPIAQVISALNQAKIDVRLVTQPVDEGGKAGK
jgi:biopolymer transport protein ExbD/biopolymer transport protein TolR